MSGADFWATAVVSFGSLEVRTAATAAFGATPLARAWSAVATAATVPFTSSVRPTVPAVTPTILPDLLTRNDASLGLRATSLMSGFRAAAMFVVSTRGP